ncbi:MAG TPA: hypothetical protein VLF63_00180 [Patescibacteria group bacterium]|nr:hypothetical protein [Patescibacteria group bacterium]
MTSAFAASQGPILSQQLLLSIAEELKMPLIRIARASEQDKLLNLSTTENTKIVQATADSAIRLLDNYILGVKLTLEPMVFNYESVSVSSILYDSKLQLEPLAKINGVNLELNTSSKIQPVLANRTALEAALISLGMTLIETIAAHPSHHQVKLQFAAHPSRYGIVAGVYAQTKQISAQALKAGRKLRFTSRQPFINLTYNNGAGIFVADAILHAMSLHLTTSRHHRLYGIGTVLKPINQMQFV